MGSKSGPKSTYKFHPVPKVGYVQRYKIYLVFYQMVLVTWARVLFEWVEGALGVTIVVLMKSVFLFLLFHTLSSMLLELLLQLKVINRKVVSFIYGTQPGSPNLCIINKPMTRKWQIYLHTKRKMARAKDRTDHCLPAHRKILSRNPKVAQLTL